MYSPRFQLTISRLSAFTTTPHGTTILICPLCLCIIINIWSQIHSAKILRVPGPLNHYFLFTHALCLQTCTWTSKYGDSMYQFRNLLEKLEELKSTSKNKSSFLDVYINDSFYEKAYQRLKPARQKLHHYQPNRQAWDNWETMESDYRWWENTRQTKQIMWFRELFTILASSHSAIVHWGWDKTEDYVKKRFSVITQKVILKHVHINVQPTPTTKKCYSTTKRNRLTIQFRQIFHKPCWNRLNRFQKLGMSM